MYVYIKHIKLVDQVNIKHKVFNSLTISLKYYAIKCFQIGIENPNTDSETKKKKTSIMASLSTKEGDRKTTESNLRYFNKEIRTSDD